MTINKIVVKKEYLGVHYYRDCPYCGLNTNLLSDDDRIYDKEKVFCRSCYEKGENKKTVTPKDFYYLSRQSEDQLLNEEQKCKNIPRLEIAHLYGEVDKENDFYLDLFHDRENDKLYFRTSIVDNPDPWFGTETFKYVNFEQAVYLLNKNGIHILDGISESNWKEYFSFQE